MSGEPAWTTCARCHSPIRPGGTCPVCTPYKTDMADLQAEVERLRGLLAQCRPYVDEARCMEDSAQRHNLGGDPAEAEALLAAIDAAGGKHD